MKKAMLVCSLLAVLGTACVTRTAVEYGQALQQEGAVSLPLVDLSQLPAGAKPVGEVFINAGAYHDLRDTLFQLGLEAKKLGADAIADVRVSTIDGARVLWQAKAVKL